MASEAVLARRRLKRLYGYVNLRVDSVATVPGSPNHDRISTGQAAICVGHAGCHGLSVASCEQVRYVVLRTSLKRRLTMRPHARPHIFIGP